MTETVWRPSGTPATSGTAGTSTGTPVLALEDLPDAVLLLDVDGDVLAANSLAVRLCTIDGAPVGHPVQEVLPLRDARGNDWWACTAAARRLPGVTRAPEQLLTCGERTLLVSARYVRDAGRLRHTVLSVRDTAARQRQERSAADLVSTVAHELRSPLDQRQGIHGNAAGQVGPVHRRAEADHAADGQRGRRSGDPADQRTARRVPDRLRPTRTAPAGRRRGERSAPRVRRAHCGRRAHGSVRPAAVTARRRRCGSTRTSSTRSSATWSKTLCGMATARSPWWSQAPDARRSQVTVTDEGEGVDEDIQSMIFAKFWRGRRRRGGTGLGLYITKGLVEAHGGTITVGRAPGGGAQFRFSLARRHPVLHVASSYVSSTGPAGRTVDTCRPLSLIDSARLPSPLTTCRPS